MNMGDFEKAVDNYIKKREDWERVRKSLVVLPDVVRVSDWFDANKNELKLRIHMDSIPDTSDVRITTEVNSDEIQRVLIIEFCMALRAGRV